MFNQFCTHIFSIGIIQYRLNVDLIQWPNAGTFIMGICEGSDLSDLVIRMTGLCV